MMTETLTVERLATGEAVLTVGFLVVKQLQDEGMVTLFINKSGEVEICPHWEIPLDGLPEDQALRALIDRGYSDDKLVEYLGGREAREATKKRNEHLRQVAL